MTIQDDLAIRAMSYRGQFAYGQGPGRDMPHTSRYTDCSAFLAMVYREVTGQFIGTYTGNMIDHGVLVTSDKSQCKRLAQPGDLLIIRWHSWSPMTYDHVEMYVGDHNRGDLMSHGGPGNGPQWRSVSDVMAECASFQLRRYVVPAPVVTKSTVIAVDGVAGPNTFGKARAVVSASRDEYMIKYLQSRLNVHGYKGMDHKTISTDGIGLFGNTSGVTPATNTCFALLCALGNPGNDGTFSFPVSDGVKAWQRKLNQGRLF